MPLVSGRWGEVRRQLVGWAIIVAGLALLGVQSYFDHKVSGTNAVVALILGAAGGMIVDPALTREIVAQLLAWAKQAVAVAPTIAEGPAPDAAPDDTPAVPPAPPHPGD